MNARGLHRYVDDLLDGRRPRPFDADGFEAAQIRTAIELRAARTASDAPSEHFLTALHRRLAARMPSGQDTPPSPPGAAPNTSSGGGRRVGRRSFRGCGHRRRCH